MNRKRVQQKNQQKELNPLSQFISDNPNAKITDVLDKDEEWNSKQNCRIFGQFVTESPERFWEMLQLINIKEDQDVENIPKKYPFIISEIIGRKEELIIDYFFQSGSEQYEFLNFLFKTIERDYIDDTLAGYFGKILKAIIDRRGFDLWKYLINPQKESKNAIEDFIKHLDVYHIADILFNLIRYDTIRNIGDDVYLDHRISLLLRLIQCLQQKNYNLLVVENVCYILKNLLTDNNEITEKEQFAQNILNSTLQFNSFLISKSSDLVDLLIVILDSIQPDQNSNNEQIVYNYYLLQEVSYNLVDLLKTELNLPQFLTTYGTMQMPLGLFKIKLIEFYLKVLKQNNRNIITYFYHQNVCVTIMELILKHEFNNSIQNLFLEIIEQLMKNNDQLEIRQAYQEANICGFLQYLNSSQKYQVGQIKQYITKGFQGIANKLSHLLKNEFKDEQWQNYINSQYNIFQNENCYLLGQNPNVIAENEDTTNQLISSLLADSNLNEEIFKQNREQTQQQFGDLQCYKQVQHKEVPIQELITSINIVQSTTVQNLPTNNESDQPKSKINFGEIDYFNQQSWDNNNQKSLDNKNQPADNNNQQSVDNNKQLSVDNNNKQFTDNNNQQSVDNNNQQSVDNNNQKSVDNNNQQSVDNNNSQSVDNNNQQLLDNNNQQNVDSQPVVGSTTQTKVENNSEIQARLFDVLSKKEPLNPDISDLVMLHYRKLNYKASKSQNIGEMIDEDNIQIRAKSKTINLGKSAPGRMTKRKYSDSIQNVSSFIIDLQIKPEKKKFEYDKQKQQ